jgi:hypothetical protein
MGYEPAIRERDALKSGFRRDGWQTSETFQEYLT